MKDRVPTRAACRRAIRLVRLLLLCVGMQAAPGLPGQEVQQQQPAPIERRPPQRSTGAASPVPGSAEGRAGHGYDPASRRATERTVPERAPRGEHLAQWMSQHQSLSPEQQQNALEQEPGFHELPSQTQQRMHDRLAQLGAMSPEQRQRRLARTEAMERLTPDQRAEVRGAMGQLGALPADQRRAVARTFRSLRDLPPDQRLQALNSGRLGPPLNDMQRSVLSNLLRVEPMLPPPQPVQPPGAQPFAPQR